MSILKTAAASRAARLVAVAGVVGASLIALAAGPAQAATTAATATPATGAATTAGAVISLKGTGFQDASGANILLQVTFESAICTTTIGATTATAFNVVSATSAVAVVPSLAAGPWYVCLYDTASGTATKILGQATYTTAAAPAPTTFAESTSNVVSAPTTGASTVTVSGTGFTKACKATVDGLAAKTTYVSATKLLVTLPAHAAKTGLSVVVTGEYGSGSSTDTISYYPSLKPSVAFGTGVVGTVVQLQSTGFSTYTFGAAVTNKVILFLPAGTALVSGTTTIASLKSCTVPIVVSDTVMTCQAPVLSPGPYTVVVAARDGTTAANYGSLTTTISRGATYTVASF